MKTAAIYSRKSKFTGKGESIENQIALCKDYAKNLGIDSFIIYEDEGFSGGNTERPQFKKMLKDAKSKKFDMLICYRLDRISRNIADFSTLMQELQELGISFISIREQFDTSTPMGRAMMYIASVFAQLERETIAERVRDNMLELAKSGRWLGGQTPLGFESEPIEYYDAEMKPRKMYKLSPVKEELEIVKLIFDKYLNFKSLSQVNKYLLSNNIKTKQGCDWNKQQVLQVLTNPVYVRADSFVCDYLSDLGMNVVGSPDGEHGILTYNKKQGNKAYKDIDEWIAAVSKHEGIIDAPIWLKIQDILKENKSKAPRLGRTHTALLSGLLKCKKCGSYMRVTYGRSRNNDGARSYYYYTCSMKNDSGGSRCDNQNVRGDQLEEIVINKIKEMTADTGILINRINSYRDEVAASSCTADIENFSEKVKNNDLMIKNLIRQLAENQDSAASKFIIAEIENLSKENDELNKKLNELKNENKDRKALELNLDIIVQSIKKFNSLIDKCDLDEKRLLLSSIIDTVYWDGSTGDVEVNLFGVGKKK